MPAAIAALDLICWVPAPIWETLHRSGKPQFQLSVLASFQIGTGADSKRQSSVDVVRAICRAAEKKIRNKGAATIAAIACNAMQCNTCNAMQCSVQHAMLQRFWPSLLHCTCCKLGWPQPVQCNAMQSYATLAMQSYATLAMQSYATLSMQSHATRTIQTDEMWGKQPAQQV